MSLKTFLKSRQFVTHFALILATVAVLVYITMLLLKVYTHHGKSLNVPDFIGLSEHDVQLVVKEKKLRYSIIDSIFVPEAVPGTIIGQHPNVGVKVKQRRTVYLTISAISPEKVIVPPIVDISLRDAQSQLENVGLRLGKVEYRPSEFLNLVLEKRLNGNVLPNDTMLVKGTEVDLIVGKGLSNERTQVPDLLGATPNEARNTLYAVSLNVGAMIFDRSVITASDSANAQVWKQKPESSAENFIELGTSVDLWLTIDQEKIFINIDNTETETEL